MRVRTDLELARRMLAGDEGAFEAFGERYPPALYRFALSRLDGDRELTRELVQTAICKALSKLDSYRGEASLLTWLCACCRNEILMHWRSRRNAPDLQAIEEAKPSKPSGQEPWETSGAVSDDAVAGGSGAVDPEVRVLRREVATLVHMALDVLPARYAEALEGKYLERLSVREVAARLGVGEKAAESLLTRARTAFKAAYEDLRDERRAFAAGEAKRNRRGRDHG